MKKLTQLQNILYAIGGVMLIAGAAMPLLMSFDIVIPIVYSIGAILFVSMQLQARYDGKDIVITRLRRQQLIGAFFLIMTAVLMWCSYFVIRPLCAGEWKISLIIGAIFQLYSAFRLSAVLEKKQA